MIEFSGNMAKECYAHIIRANRKTAQISSIIVVVPILICCIVLTFVWNVIAILLMPCLALFVIFSGIAPKELGSIVPTRVTINDEEIVAQSDKFVVKKSILEVKQILDYGDCYFLKFSNRPFYSNFVCQKNLLVSGTIEEFETKFKNKILRYR